tara:strand:+ start:1545 stop:2234 length:690 start_codon:yes stop_codon:yes gene_type:complete
MSKIKGIAFDKDGTLIDFEASWSKGLISLIESIFPNQTDKQHVLAEEIGFNLGLEKFVGGSVFVNGTTDDVIDVWKKFFPDLIIDDIKEKSEIAFKNLEPVPLCNLEFFMSNLKKKGYFLSVITNAAEAPTLIQLEKLGCLNLFDEVIGCDSGFKSKPSGDTILGFCNKVGLKPAEIAMVGDSTHDLNAGRDAGVGLNVGVLSGPATNDQLSGLADVILDDILGLSGIL